MDSYTAVTQLVDYIKSDVSITRALKDSTYAARGAARAAVHEARIGEIASNLRLEDGERLDVYNVGSLLKSSLVDSTTFVVEAVTSAQTLYDKLQPDRPGSWINCGGALEAGARLSALDASVLVDASRYEGYSTCLWDQSHG